jgi:hypothetical protein
MGPRGQAESPGLQGLAGFARFKTEQPAALAEAVEKPAAKAAGS